MTRYKLLKSSISLEDFEDLLAFLVAGFDFDKNQAKPWALLNDSLALCYPQFLDFFFDNLIRMETGKE